VAQTDGLKTKMTKADRAESFRFLLNRQLGEKITSLIGRMSDCSFHKKLETGLPDGIKTSIWINL
jgi:hypothetical protein